MALSDWEEIIIDETGEIFDWFSFNGIEIGIQKNWIDIDTDDLSFSVLSSNLLIKGINVYVGQYYDLQAVFLFLRFFDGGMNRFNYQEPAQCSDQSRHRRACRFDGLVGGEARSASTAWLEVKRGPPSDAKRATKSPHSVPACCSM